MTETEHQKSYIQAIQTLLPHWAVEQCRNAMLTHFTCGKERVKAHKSLGKKRYDEYHAKARNVIAQWDRWAVYDMSGNYLATTYQSSSVNAIKFAKEFHPSCNGKERLTARRLGLLEIDPFYLPSAKPDKRPRPG